MPPHLPPCLANQFLLATRLLACPTRHTSPPQSDRPLALPHLSVADIRWVDWGALRAAGFRGCVFDKDNTLTGGAGQADLAACAVNCRQTAYSGCWQAEAGRQAPILSACLRRHKLHTST